MNKPVLARLHIEFVDIDNWNIRYDYNPLVKFPNDKIFSDLFYQNYSAIDNQLIYGFLSEVQPGFDYNRRWRILSIENTGFEEDEDQVNIEI